MDLTSQEFEDNGGDRVEFEKELPGRGGGGTSYLALWKANLIWEKLTLTPGVPRHHAWVCTGCQERGEKRRACCGQAA